MGNFKRNDMLFSLCGLNCGLCPMQLGNYCPGCGGGSGNQICSIARCSMQKDNVNYCYQCSEYPCSKYDGITDFDSFITHKNQLKDMEKAKRIGMDAYHFELTEKMEILNFLLANYNDGRRKTFYCVAVNLLDLQDIRDVVKQIKEATASDNLTAKDKAVIAVNLFQDVAKQRNLILKLNKKPKKK